MQDINEQINDYIIETKLWHDEEGVYITWAEIAKLANDEFLIELTANAARKRFKRNYSGMDDSASIVTKNAAELDTEMTEGDSDGVIASLRQQFGVGNEYAPRKIKTTATDDKVWQSVEWVREEINEDKLDEILEQIKNHVPDYHQFTPLVDDEENLLVPVLYDAHVDKASLNGGKNYLRVVDEMIETALGLNINIGRVMLVIGNDFGNVDNVHGGTTAGTPQQNKYHWARGIDLRCEYAIGAVERFSSIANTDVIMVHGNHDRYSNQWLGKVLEAQFGNNERVSVDNTHSPRKYYLWARNMWGFVHGNEENPAMLPAIMATEKPTMWGFSKYREVYTGHFHRKQHAYYALTEQNGLTIRWMPALSGLDDWHNLKGYIGARRAGLGIVYGQDGYKMEYSIDV